MADDTPITISQELAFKMLDVLRETHIYTLMGSELESELPADFKPHKWEPYRGDHAQASVDVYRELLTAMDGQVRP